MSKAYHFDAETGKFVIRISENISMRLDSHDLLISSREKLRILFAKGELERKDLIEALIALHLVMEVGMNTFYRQLYLMIYKIPVDQIGRIRNIDEVSFIDKTKLFISASTFSLVGYEDEARRHSTIIGKMKIFTELRNLLLHGHAISTVVNDGGQLHSKLKNRLTADALIDQIIMFKEIMTGVQFYLDHLDSPLTADGKESLKRSFLDVNFFKD